jgi:hypothetical protein
MQKVRGEFEQCRQRNVAEIERLRLKLQECHTESDAEILMLQTQLENTRMGIQRKVEEEVKRMEDASMQLHSLENEAVHAKSRAEVENLSRENQKLREESEQCRLSEVAEIERLRLKLQESHTGNDAEILMLQTQLENNRMGIQRKVEEEVKRMEDASRQLRSLECEAVHAKSRAEVENLSRENQQFRAQIENQHQHQREREDAVAEQQKRHLDEIRGFLADAKEEARRVRDEKERLHDKVELLHNEQRSFLSTMSGSSSSKGNLGESLVANAFSNLSRMGTLENTSKNQNEGFADYFWTKDYQGETPGIRCGVEAKYVSGRLHSKHDTGKFDKFVADGVSQKRINCAILISERCHIQNTEQIDIRIEHGIVVVRASRGEDDDLSIDSLIKLAFVATSEIWPLLGVHLCGDDGTVVRDVASFLGGTLSRLSSLDRLIQYLDDSGLKMIRESANLKETKNGVLQDIQTLRLQHRQLGGDGDQADSVETIDATGALAKAIEEFHTTHKRYPKPNQTGNLGLTKDLLQACNDQNLFAAAISNAKETIKGKKRKRHMPLAGMGAPAADNGKRAALTLQTSLGLDSCLRAQY